MTSGLGKGQYTLCMTVLLYDSMTANGEEDGAYLWVPLLPLMSLFENERLEG